jgi:hypothetical protein
MLKYCEVLQWPCPRDTSHKNHFYRARQNWLNGNTVIMLSVKTLHIQMSKSLVQVDRIAQSSQSDVTI